MTASHDMAIISAMNQETSVSVVSSHEKYKASIYFISHYLFSISECTVKCLLINKGAFNATWCHKYSNFLCFIFICFHHYFFCSCSFGMITEFDCKIYLVETVNFSHEYLKNFLFLCSNSRKHATKLRRYTHTFKMFEDGNITFLLWLWRLLWNPNAANPHGPGYSALKYCQPFSCLLPLLNQVYLILQAFVKNCIYHPRSFNAVNCS